ncbi:response regulator [Noviherbaspirillum saxi]|uniref:Response regulator n=1 Tax=Noviherbaspirillum saxi TaxID=2320863 RepID=A0A3A3FV49_9BURK|nr:response regulator [Noviherbaspirillum saxi]RJF98021.1 response regulator [Noviherbaspirillum saxi]
MSNSIFPFAVRLIGFSDEETGSFDLAFGRQEGKGYGYFRLAEDNLQDPDMYVVNADQLKAMITLADLRASEVRPALLVGNPQIDLSHPRIPHPIVWNVLFAALDELVEKRADALSRLEASDIVIVPERRRRHRLDIDLTVPAEYEKMRAKIPEDGAVLIVDKNTASRDYLSDLLSRQQVPVLWAGDELSAVELCKKQSIAVVMINTSTPGVDPYRLCWGVKEKNSPVKISVILLVSKPFEYDAEQARYVGIEGFLNKPLASHHLITVLKKFLPRGR